MIPQPFRICGIDPGNTGAFCFMDLHEDTTIKDIKLFKMPTQEVNNRIQMDLNFLTKWLILEQGTKFFIEKAQFMGTNSGMFQYGKGYGILLGILHAYQINYHEVPPSTWTKEMHAECLLETKNPKEKSSYVAHKLFPNINLLLTERSKKPHTGFIDALLIAEYGRRKIQTA